MNGILQAISSLKISNGVSSRFLRLWTRCLVWVRKFPMKTKISLEKIVPLTEKIVPFTEKIVPLTEKIVPLTEKILPLTEKILPLTEKIVPLTWKDRTFSRDDRMP